MFESSRRKKVQAHIKECNSNNLYTLFQSKYFQELLSKKLNREKFNYFCDLTKKCDDALAVPEQIGEYLESLMNDDNLIIGIHRTAVGDDLLNDNKMRSIIERGLINYGDLSSGTIHERANLGKTISFPGNVLNAMLLLKSTYKGSTGGFIFAFPKTVVDKEGIVTDYNVNYLYNNINGVNYIKPEYIVGYVDNSYGVMNFYSREELLNCYNKDNSTNPKMN